MYIPVVVSLSQKLTVAVNAAFIRLFNEGLIYRDSRIVNWCYALKTAISDIELDYVEGISTLTIFDSSSTKKNQAHTSTKIRGS